ncbi:hypothetical protein OAF61_03955 [Pseudomonadales bacterium]|nr:hypothetical protein [Pseudomonadales bacterium]
MKMRVFLSLILVTFSGQNFADNHRVFYEGFNEDVPKIGAVAEVYLGDAMMTQRYGTYQRCLLSKLDTSFTWKEIQNSNCLSSSESFYKKCCHGDGQYKIEKGGVLCKVGDKNKNRYAPENFYTLEWLDGKAPEKEIFTLKETKSKVRFHAPSGRKVVDVNTERFRDVFSSVEKYGMDVVFLTRGEKLCRPWPSANYVSTKTNFASDWGRLRNSDDEVTLTPSRTVELRIESVGADWEISPELERNGEPVLPIFISDSKFQELFETSERYVIDSDKSQRSIEYVGKQGNVLRFLYSETADGFAREAWSRDFQIDLDEGNIGAFKGAVFEVLKATNATIEYRVIRSF